MTGERHAHREDDDLTGIQSYGASVEMFLRQGGVPLRVVRGGRHQIAAQLTRGGGTD